MRYVTLLFFILFLACGQGKRYHDKTQTAQVESPAIADILGFQKELDQSFKDPETSPLLDRHRKNFKGLDYFEPDTTYVVKAKFERTPDAEPFLLPTTTDRESWEVVYGIAHFNLNGVQHQLEVYQTLGLAGREDYKDYLFLPFLDETNGDETYGGGRYIDLSIPDGDTLVIDFQQGLQSVLCLQ